MAVVQSLGLIAWSAFVAANTYRRVAEPFILSGENEYVEEITVSENVTSP